MTAQIYTYILHKDGKIDDTALELLTAAKKLNPEAAPIAIVAGCGAELVTVCNELNEFYAQIIKIDNEVLTYINAEVLRDMLVRIVPKKSVVLLAHGHFGMDLGPGLSIKLNGAYLPDIIDITNVEGESLMVVREEFNGQLSCHVSCNLSDGAVITVRPSAFKVSEEKAGSGKIVDRSVDVLNGGNASGTRRFIKIIEAEKGDVDITKSEVLIAVGRGIGEEDNLEIIQALAEVMGAEIACSRPIVDAKWMEKSRQVGTSGLTVKPKVYLACGISGSFQHVGGIKGNPYIVAINKSPNAPIFQKANVGIVADILDFIPKLTAAIGKRG